MLINTFVFAYIYICNIFDRRESANGAANSITTRNIKKNGFNLRCYMNS